MTRPRIIHHPYAGRVIVEPRAQPGRPRETKELSRAFSPDRVFHAEAPAVDEAWEPTKFPRPELAALGTLLPKAKR